MNNPKGNICCSFRCLNVGVSVWAERWLCYDHWLQENMADPHQTLTPERRKENRFWLRYEAKMRAKRIKKDGLVMKI